MKRIFKIIIAGLLLFVGRPVFAELLSIDGTPVKEKDIIEVQLRDIHPTQPIVGFDEIYYKLQRFTEDRRKIFREYCKHNGQLEVSNLTDASNLHDPTSFSCLEPVGMTRSAVKTVVIAPNGQLYLTNGHHSLIEFWNMPGGGPDLRIHVVVDRDYRKLPSMDEFWEHMQSEQNVWLFDADGKPISIADLPANFDLKYFKDDPYRSLLYFTRKIAWNSPEKFPVPDSDDYYPAIPYVEFFWAREIRKTVNLAAFDLNTHDGYVTAIRAVGHAIMNVQVKDVGGSGKTLVEVGQFHYFNEKELIRIDRSDTGKLAYMLKYKAAHCAEKVAASNHSEVRNTENTSAAASN